MLRRIHTDYAQPLDVAALAREAGLSVPAFHAHFKTVAATSPIQYIKSVRLHQARLMMIRDHVTAAGAAVRVGYESPSQFNRASSSACSAAAPARKRAKCVRPSR